MSAHIEWLAARETSVQVFAPGEDWIGAGEHRQPVLTLAGDDVVAIQGTPAELRALAARITAVAAAAAGRLERTSPHERRCHAACPGSMRDPRPLDSGR